MARWKCKVCGQEHTGEKPPYNSQWVMVCHGKERGEDFYQHTWEKVKPKKQRRAR